MTIDDLPGFRRSILVSPGRRSVTANLEDDIHRMAVTLIHDGDQVVAVEPVMERAPWSLCPGAVAQLQADWQGATLADTARGIDKKANCTHLFDLAELAARHAFDAAETRYEILASDPVEGFTQVALRRNGEERLRWDLRDDVVTSPTGPAGLPLLGLRSWIVTLSGVERAEARMLQWASLVAHGRHIAWETESTLRALPGSCFASQPQRYAQCERTGDRIDFSASGTRLPLDPFQQAGA